MRGYCAHTQKINAQLISRKSNFLNYTTIDTSLIFPVNTDMLSWLLKETLSPGLSALPETLPFPGARGAPIPNRCNCRMDVSVRLSWHSTLLYRCAFCPCWDPAEKGGKVVPFENKHKNKQANKMSFDTFLCQCCVCLFPQTARWQHHSWLG